MTLVEGDVSSNKKEQFEAAYRSVKGESLPPGLEMSFLLRNSDEPGSYTIETIWSSREALDAMRSSMKPRAVALFEDVGVSPRVEIHEVAESVP